MIQPREPLDTLIQRPQSYTSHLAFPDPATIMLYDDTLRDGEQMPGVAFSPAQKLKLATLLGEIGIDVMDVAFPVGPASDRLALAANPGSAGRQAPSAAIWTSWRCAGPCPATSTACSRSWPRPAPPADVSVLILSTLSDLHLKYKLGRALLAREGRDESEWLDTPLEFYREANIRLITDAIRYARARHRAGRVRRRGRQPRRSAVRDGVGEGQRRGRWHAVLLLGHLRRVHARRRGPLLPADRRGARCARRRVQLTAHFHNDFGLGALNTVRAVMHGATHPSLTANGIGERAGNTSIHQFVMVLKELYGVTLPRFRYDRLNELRQAVEDASGVPISRTSRSSAKASSPTNPACTPPASWSTRRSTSSFARRPSAAPTASSSASIPAPAAVEAVLQKHADLLAAQGLAVGETLVGQRARARERVARDHDRDRATTLAPSTTSTGTTIGWASAKPRSSSSPSSRRARTTSRQRRLPVDARDSTAAPAKTSAQRSLGTAGNGIVLSSARAVDRSRMVATACCIFFSRSWKRDSRRRLSNIG